jgi:heat shock protein beta
MTKLGLDIGALEAEFEQWQYDRTHCMHVLCVQMLGKSSFIELWRRLRKIGREGVEGGIKANDLGEDEGEGEGGSSKVDMRVPDSTSPCL